MSSSFFDRSTTLCLACSSSLPPLKGASTSSSANSIHVTTCCQRPICPACISANPRLARYNPCLSCLGGVDVVSASRDITFLSNKKGKTPLPPNFGPSSNLDGSLRDQDAFILGDDDDEDDVLSTYDGGIRVRDSGAPPPYTSICEHSSGAVAPPQTSHVQHPSDSTNPDPNASPNSRMVITSANSAKATPYKYYLDRKDTLQGLALRFGIDGHEICRMNKLPPSVLRTTPHLLHTRSFLLLPPSAKPHPSLTLSTAEEEALEAKLVRERAEKRLQTLTKEADWRIAKAYVALADDNQVQKDFSFKRKEMGFAKGNVQTASASKLDGLEALAVAHYLDDEEWEAEERRAGRDVQVLRLPTPDSNQAQATNEKWWGRRKS